MNLWRISNHLSLKGEGGRRAPARWHSGGEPIVYLAESPPGALLEILVHLELPEVSSPITYTLLRIAVPDRLKIPSLTVPTTETWKNDETLTRKLGDAWLKSRRSALARVPSSILPNTENYLLNPLNPDAARIKIAETHSAILDPRLIR
jgi:RES domain-containing protein